MESQNKPLPQNKIKINIVKKGQVGTGKCLILYDNEIVNIKWLLQLAKNKFNKFSAKSVYIQETETILESDEQLIEILRAFSLQYSQEEFNKPSLTFVFSTEKSVSLPQGKRQISQTELEQELVSEEKVSQDLASIDLKSQDSQQEVTQSQKKIHVIAKHTKIEEESMKQLSNALRLPGCIMAYGMPDLHPGKGIPIGASIITDGIIYPELVDSDIGCGMSFVRTGMQASKLKSKKITKISQQLTSIDCPWSSKRDDYENFCNKEISWGNYKVDKLDLNKIDDEKLSVMGTIGGGNHFAEFQEIHEVYDQEVLDKLKIDLNEVYLLIHSGSRSFGESILQKFLEDHKQDPNKGAKEGTEEFKEYMKGHDIALNYARRNRFLIGHRILSQINSRKQQIDQEFGIKDTDCLIDIFHNFVEKITIVEENDKQKDVWIHRKGATPSTHNQYLVIPGSRGSYSYLVEVNKDNVSKSGYSLAHGAGRRMNRSKALALNKSQHPNPQNLLKTEIDSLVVCENKTLIYEEAPNAYKNIEDVILDLVEFDLVRVIAKLRPLITYKFKEPGFKKTSSE